MKIKEIASELEELVKSQGFKIRRDSGRFKSGFCYVNEEKVVLLNKNTSAEAAANIFARCLASAGNSDDMFVKPAVREFIDRERETGDDFILKVSQSRFDG
ncbi:MAG: hypothetical protein ACM3U1_06985 [Chloroflexota bacterium]